MNFGFHFRGRRGKSFTAENAEDAEEGPGKLHRRGREEYRSEIQPQVRQDNAKGGNGGGAGVQDLQASNTVADVANPYLALSSRLLLGLILLLLPWRPRRP